MRTTIPVPVDAWESVGNGEAAYVSPGGYQSDNALIHQAEHPYEVTTLQTLVELENGYYTLTAWTQSSGGQQASYLVAREGGASEARAAIPAGDSWTRVYLRGVQVTDNRLTVGVHSKGQASQWLKLDNMELVKDDQPYRLLKGGDVSELSYIESRGGKFLDCDGKEKDLFLILKENGHDIVRIRNYNNPGKGRGDGTYYRPAGISDKADVLHLARRAKAAGLQIQLSFHYSDYWTNGATHIIPHAWQEAIRSLPDDAAKVDRLEELMYDYTLDLMQAMVEQGTLPEYVSLGNEIQSGILFPYGQAAGETWPHLARFLSASAKAVRDVSSSSRIIIHLDEAGNYDKYEGFFDEALRYGLDYDIIGPSYYPFWINLPVEDIVVFLNHISKRYDKDIMIMETGYNWSPTLPSGYPGQLSNNGPYPQETSSPQGQKEFMINLFNGLKSVEGGRVIGDLYWDPIMIERPGVGWALRESDDQAAPNVVSNTTLFDFDGKALPVMDVYKHNTEGRG